MGYAPRAVVEHAAKPADEYGRGGETDRHTSLNASVPLAPEIVYDLVNAGPRRRFVVMGDSGPFIVHNCENITQGFAASLLRHCMKRIEFGRGIYADERPDSFELVMHTHDEVVGEGDEHEALDFARYLKKEMEFVPDFAEGLPLAAEITKSWYYSKVAKELHL
jgi:hypothetical protein